MTVAWWLLALGMAIPVYAYLLYPALLRLVVIPLTPPTVAPPGWEWPAVSITLPVYNEERVIAATLDTLLALRYPAGKVQILVISDASTDRTDAIVSRYADRGVELLRLDRRSGKTAAENAARHHLRGDVVVNTDASVRVSPGSLEPLIRALADPTVGVASGRDISVAGLTDTANVGEGGYVGYEMWLRDLETRAGGIVGASGCFYASRIPLHMEIVPEALSRDFAAPLIAKEAGFRAVSVRDAICYVPRAGSLRREYRRKVRTMTRGLETLYYKRHLLNPLRYGRFAWMLASHKLVRWLMPWGAVLGLAGLSLLVLRFGRAGWLLGLIGLWAVLGVAAWRWPEQREMPSILAVPGYLFWSIIASMHAWISALRGDLNPVWEPTRRGLSVSVRRDHPDAT